MLILQGKVIGVVEGEFTNKETQVTSKTLTVEILHKSKGKSKVDTVKIEPGVLEAWKKAEGHEVSQEVSLWSIGAMSGMSLADKNDLPNFVKKSPAA